MFSFSVLDQITVHLRISFPIMANDCVAYACLNECSPKYHLNLFVSKLPNFTKVVLNLK